MPKSKYPVVAIIILNWNGKKLLKTCLSSLFKLTDYPNYKVIVVDNGSTDGSVEFVKKYFPKADVLALDKNYGYAKGNNEGIKYALKKYNPDYVLLLNNDTKIIQKNWLTETVRFSVSNSIDVISVQQISKDHHAIASEAINIFSYGVEYKNISYENAFLGGWFLLIKKKRIEEILNYFGEIFPSEYFCYMEDSFLYWVLKIINARTYLFTKVGIIHYGGGSGGGKGNPFALRMCQRNSIFNIYVFYNPLTIVTLIPLYMVFTTFNLLYRILYQKSSLRAKSVLYGFIDGLSNFKKVRKYKVVIKKLYTYMMLSDDVILKSSTYKLFTERSVIEKTINKMSKLYLKIFRVKTLDD